MELVTNSKDAENDETWQQLIDILFAEETDVLDEDYVDIEDFIYAGVWLSLNMFALEKKLYDNLMERLNDPKQSPAVRILEAIDYLAEDDDRESEIMLMLQLLQYAPNVHKQVEDVLFDPELSSSYKYSRMLLIDDDVFDDEGDDQDIEINVSNKQYSELHDESSDEDEDPDIPF
jgi:hypothetical protein